MKRGCVWLLVPAFLLVACSSGGGDTMPSRTARPSAGEAAITLTFACLDHQRGDFESLAENYEEANPGLRIQFISADEASGMQRQGSAVTSDGNEIQRLARAADTFVWFARFAPTDWSSLLDLTPFVDDPAFPLEDFYSGTLDHFRWQGSIRGLPASVSPFLVFYDKQMFDATGVPYPEIGWHWDNLLEAASQLTTREGDEIRRYGFVDTFFAYTVLSMPQQFGVPLWDDGVDPPQPLFNTPDLGGIVQRYTDLALLYEVMPVPEVGSNVMASDLINEGRAAIWTEQAFDLDWHRDRTDVGVAPFPEQVDAANPRSMQGFFASAGTAHPGAAWHWLSYLSANYHPPLAYLMPGRRSVAEQLSWWRQLDGDTRSVFEYALAHPAASDPRDRPLWLAAIAVFEQGSSSEEALAIAQAQALEMQAASTEAAEVELRPVASPELEPGQQQVLVRFAPAPLADGTLYRELAAGFGEEHPGIKVEIVAYPSNPAELAQNTDCLAASVSLGASWAEDRLNILSLKPLLDADARIDLADFYPQFLQPLQRGSELWGLPYEVDALMVYLNLDRFTEAEVNLPATDWTIQEFLSTAAALTYGGNNGFTTREGAYGDLLFVLERLGAHLYDGTQDPPMPTFDDATVVATLEQYAALARQGALAPGTPSTESGWPDSMVIGTHPGGVQAGQVAMWVDSIQHQGIAPPLSFETGIVPLPMGAEASTEFDVLAFYISAHSPAPQACWQWLIFLSEKPEVVQMLPARRSVATSPSWQERVGKAALSPYRATLEVRDASIFRLRWEIPWLGYAYPWLHEAFQAAVAGQDARTALAEAQAMAEAFVACLQAAGSFDREKLHTCARQVDPSYPLPAAER